MIATSSKWNYIAFGISMFLTLFGAMLHTVNVVILGFIFVVWNWHVAEFKYKNELKQYAEENKNGESITGPKDEE